MSRLLIAVLALSCAAAHAEVYRCPQTYPGNDAPPAPLTGAYMMWGERPNSGPPFPAGWITPEEKVAEEGLDSSYTLPPDEQGWLICEYGATKRLKGRSHDGHEWGQRMNGGGKYPWFMKLIPKVGVCTVQLREIKSRRPEKNTWTATAICN
jgi:hypothetical protein